MDFMKRLRSGIDLEDGPARALEAQLVSTEDEGGVLCIVLAEGRKREVRRLCQAVSHPVRWLRRVRFGPVELADLSVGEWRELTAEEVDAIRERVEPPKPS